MRGYSACEDSASIANASPKAKDIKPTKQAQGFVRNRSSSGTRPSLEHTTYKARRGKPQTRNDFNLNHSKARYDTGNEECRNLSGQVHSEAKPDVHAGVDRCVHAAVYVHNGLQDIQARVVYSRLLDHLKEVKHQTRLAL